ncbi:MAG: hypothetical protein ACXV79_00705 [Methylobacter sp.]
MAKTIISRPGLFAIYAVGGDEKRPFIGTRAECIRHALKTDGDSRQNLHGSRLKHLPTPDWWLLQTVEEWAVQQLPFDHPGVMSAYSDNKGKKMLRAADLQSWIDDWLMNGEKPVATANSLFRLATQYLQDIGAATFSYSH